MRNGYFFLLLFFPLLLSAQDSNKTYVTFGLGQSHAHLRTSSFYRVYGTGFSSTSRIGNSHSSRALGISLGLSRQLHHRWEVAVRGHYSGGTSRDTIGGFNFLQYGLEDKQIRDRKYRAAWVEGLIFWRVVDSRSLVDIQIGTGLAYLRLQQEYDSGFIYNADIDVLTPRNTFEKTGQFGLPFHFQLQYPINYNFKIGGSINVNAYFNHGHVQSGASVFAAYRW